jgi:putative lipoprotein (rSAM/lipoprotein system)
MPSADYTVSGKVQSFDSGEPIEGILVSIRDTSESSVIMDSIKTDSSGRYYLEFSNAPSDNIRKCFVFDEGYYCFRIGK